LRLYLAVALFLQRFRHRRCRSWSPVRRTGGPDAEHESHNVSTLGNANALSYRAASALTRAALSDALAMASASSLLFAVASAACRDVMRREGRGGGGGRRPFWWRNPRSCHHFFLKGRRWQ
jgi:hypothetical protein